MASEAELADLYLTLRAVNQPLLDAFAQTASAGEDMVAALDTTLTEFDARIAEAADASFEQVTAAVENTATSTETFTTSMSGSLTGLQESFDATAASANAAAIEIAAAYDAMAAAAAEEEAARSTDLEQSQVITGELISANDAYIASMVNVGAAAEEEAVAYRAATDEILAAMAQQVAASRELSAAVIPAAEENAAAVKTGTDEMVADYEASTTKIIATTDAAEAASGSLMATLTPWAVAGAAAAYAIDKVVTAGADLQTAMTRLSTSGGELQSNIAGDTTAIEQLAGQVGLSATALATGMYTVTSAGFQGANAITVLTAAAQGAVTEQADLGTVVNAVTDLLNDYHLSASNATQVTSAMITAVSLGKTTFQNLSAAMSIVSPTAAAVGVSIQDLLGDLSEATAHGISADEAAQQLANTLRSLSSPTSTVTAELGQLGLSSVTLSQNLGKTGVSGALEQIQQAVLTKMGPAGTVLLSSFNQSKVAAANAATAMSGLGSAAQKVAQQYASGQMTGGFAAWSAALKGLSAPQANLLNQWKALQDSSNGFSNALKTGGGDVQSYTQAMAKATGNASTLQTALVLTGQNFNTTSGDITKIKTALDGSSTSVSGFAQQQQTLNAKLNDAKAGFGALAASIGEKLLPIITKIVGVFATVAAWLSKHQQIATALAYVIGGVLVIALAAVAAGMAFLALMIIPIVQGAQELISHWSDIAGFFKGLWKDVTTQFDGGVSAVKDVITWFENLPGEIGGFFQQLPGVLGRAASSAGNALLTGLKTAGTATLTFLKNLPASAGHALGELAGTLARQAVDAAKAFYTGITTEFTETLHFFEDLPANVGKFLTSASTWLDNAGMDVLKGLENGITTQYEDVKKWFENLPGDIKGFFSDVFHWLETSGVQLQDGFYKGIGDGFQNVIHWLENLGPTIIGWLSDAGSWLGNTGLNIVKGLWNGIQSGASWLLKQVKSFASNVISGFESAFGLGSPSRITYQHGVFLVQGYANALRDNAGLMVSAATSVANQTLSAFAGRGSVGSMALSVAGGGGLAAGGAAAMAPVGGGGAGMTVVNMPVTVNGSVVTDTTLTAAMQKAFLQLSSRNVGFGTNVAFS